MLAGADAEDHALRKQQPEGAECVGDDRGVLAKSGCRDRGSESDASRSLADGGQPREGKGRMAVGVTPGLEMVADENRIESVGLGRDREIEQLARAELLSRSLVAEPQLWCGHYGRLKYRFQLNATPLIAAAATTTPSAIRLCVSKLAMPTAVRNTTRTTAISIITTSEIARWSFMTRLAYRSWVERKFCAWRRSDRKSTRLNSSHSSISYAVFCLKKKKKN